MNKVDELIEEIVVYGRRCREAGICCAEDRPIQASIWTEDAAEKLAELRTALTGAVSEWRVIDDAAKSGELMHVMDQRTGFVACCSYAPREQPMPWLNHHVPKCYSDNRFTHYMPYVKPTKASEG